MAPSLVVEAIRKARSAIYYSFGEPAFVENVVREVAEETQSKSIEDPVLKCLVEIEETVRQMTQLGEFDGERVMKEADSLVQLASDIVEVLTGEKIED